MHKRASIKNIPPFKNSDGEWIRDSKVKANLFAKTWTAKSELPVEDVEQFFAPSSIRQSGKIILRTRNTKQNLAKFDENKATGPDKISAKILKILADELAYPLTILLRRMLFEAICPERWKTHLVCPIYKKSSAFLPQNYRGIHLINVISKVAEKVIGAPLIKFLQTCGYGKNQ